MNLKEMWGLLDDIEFPDYQFAIKPDKERLYLQANYVEKDIQTGLREVQFTRKWLLSEHMTKSEFVQTVFKCVMTSMEHRAREGFTYRERRVFGPHFNVDLLWELAGKKAGLDYREEP